MSTNKHFSETTVNINMKLNRFLNEYGLLKS